MIGSYGACPFSCDGRRCLTEFSFAGRLALVTLKSAASCIGDQVSVRSELDIHVARGIHMAYVGGEDQDHPPFQACWSIHCSTVYFEPKNQRFTCLVKIATRCVSCCASRALFSFA